jgi:hypothetical protein
VGVGGFVGTWGLRPKYEGCRIPLAVLRLRSPRTISITRRKQNLTDFGLPQDCGTLQGSSSKNVSNPSAAPAWSNRSGTQTRPPVVTKPATNTSKPSSG